jgi:hypothetical protein
LPVLRSTRVRAFSRFPARWIGGTRHLGRAPHHPTAYIDGEPFRSFHWTFVVHGAGTGQPFSNAGLYRQDQAQRIAASSSISWPLDLATCTLETLPLVLTVNLMMVEPCWLRRTAIGGYCLSQVWDAPIETGAVMPRGLAGAAGAGRRTICTTGAGMTGRRAILATLMRGGGRGVSI